MSPQMQGAALVILRDGRTFKADDAVFDHGLLHARARRQRGYGANRADVVLGVPRGYSWPREAIREVRWEDQS